MSRLPYPEVFHLQAACGWLELGNVAEARAELEKLAPSAKAHPEALKVFGQVYARERRWDAVLNIGWLLTQQEPDEPKGWMFVAQALYELGRNNEAYRLLAIAKQKLQQRALLFYELARASAQRHEIAQARDWFEAALKIGDAEKLRSQAMQDPDLKQLWTSKG